MFHELVKALAYSDLNVPRVGYSGGVQRFKCSTSWLKRGRTTIWVFHELVKEVAYNDLNVERVVG
jgi:hypothetical protein